MRASSYHVVRSCLVVVFGLCILSSLADEERAYYRYYYKQPIRVSADPASIAVFDSRKGSPVEVLSLLPPGTPLDVEVRKFPVPGWSIIMGGVASSTPMISRIPHFILRDKAERFFLSPVFYTPDSYPYMMAPEILVRFKRQVSASHLTKLVHGLGAEVTSIGPLGGMKNAFTIVTTERSGERVLEIANGLAILPDVVFAEPNIVGMGTADFTPNDPLYPQSWWLHNTGQFSINTGVDVGAPEAWDLGFGNKPIIVVIIDTGVQQDHPDINQMPGMDFTGKGGNGGPVDRCDNHGTPVAGLVAGRINNSIGTTGIAPNVIVASARALNSEDRDPCNANISFQTLWTVNALQWAEEIGARVTNNSNNYKSLLLTAMEEKYQETYEKGMIHFASAGNDAAGTVGVPAIYPSVNAVSGITFEGEFLSYSNSGEDVAFTAPGAAVWTTDRTGADGYGSDDYYLFGGTSAASPIAAGVAAFVLSIRDDFGPQELEAHLRATAVDFGEPGWDEKFGWGLPNARKAADPLVLIFSDGFESGGTDSWSTP